jgi:3-oxoadipate enol-lactonase
LVLADCGAVFTEPGRAAFRGMSAMAKEKGLAAIADVAMRRLFSPAYQEAHPELTAQRKAHFLTVDPQTFHNACAALASLDLREQASKVSLPALVMAGELDEATPPPMSRELAGLLPNAQLHILENCAHVPQLQEPAQFLAAIGKFIAA